MRITVSTLALLAAGVVASGSAEAAGGIATTDLNLRAGPGPQYPVVDSIPSGGSVEIHGCTESTLWCDVSIGEARGFAYARYLAFEESGRQVALPEAVARAGLPQVAYDPGAYFDQNYRGRPVYEQRSRIIDTTGATATTGLAAGAVTGALIAGPLGAAIGGVSGAALGAIAAPPQRVEQYVTTSEAAPVLLDGEVVIGAGVPEGVVLSPVPDYEYGYAVINGQRVLIDPATRRIVHVYR